MTPGARIQAVIDLLTEVATIARPADAVISAFFRKRRYIGSKDRVAIAENVYAVLRRYARLSWWLVRADYCPPTPQAASRAMVMANILLTTPQSATALLRTFNGARFHPEAANAEETRLARALETHTLELPAMPENVRLECPPWAEAALRAGLGERFGVEMAALLEPAPLDVRINPMKTQREDALAALAADGIIAAPGQFSPFALRIEGRPALTASKAFQNGWVEIQDEGSQLVALLVDARPGQQVVDFCAGAGGKTLAVAAAMANKGRVVACDVLENRLKRATERFRRAGLHNIETRAFSSERDPWVKRHKEKFDRVLVDAPCAGVGTWRRNPDARWRSLGPGLTELVELQARILDSAARLVKPGGRLIYATCSLLTEENEDQIAAFVERNPSFQILNASEIWTNVITETPWPGDLGPFLRLFPARHHTDGFFAAILTHNTTEDRSREDVSDQENIQDVQDVQETQIASE
ncbi:16S rRNA (cytosine967-C5)-methyltransferase [Azospirillaceae bacterium]